MKWRLTWSAALGVTLLCAPAWSADPIAYITEIQRKGKGTALVKRMGQPDAQPAQPLLSLRRGDEVRVWGDVQVVLLYHAGTGTQTVSPSNSPFIVQAPTSAGTNDRLRVLVATVGQMFLNQQSLPTYRPVAVRGGEPNSSTPVIVSPRRTRLFPGPVTFEWDGSEKARYGIRVLGPHGVIWEERNVLPPRITYPTSAPLLVDGVRYMWEVEASGQPVQRTDFELISAAEATRIRDVLGALRDAAREGYSPGTVPLLRAALLLDEGLYVDARRELQAAVEANRGEPAYQMLLGHVYRRIGLTAYALEAFERARALSELEPAASRP